jgi:hypothetical protein
MTRNDIIRMAEEAGFGANQRATLRLKLQRFAALVAAADAQTERLMIERDIAAKLKERNLWPHGK